MSCDFLTGLASCPGPAFCWFLAVPWLIVVAAEIRLSALAGRFVRLGGRGVRACLQTGTEPLPITSDGGNKGLRFEQGAICGAGGIKVPASHSDAFYPYAALRERACSVSSPEAPTNVWPKSLVLVGGGFV